MVTQIKGGRVIDPGKLDGLMDVFVQEDKIIKIESPAGGAAGVAGGPDRVPAVERVIDATGLIVCPGLVDMHVHLREPGFEYKETIHTGCLAAAHGGITSVCPMPNTAPVNDSAEVTTFMLEKARQARASRVFPVAAISRGLEGKTLSDFGELKEAGAVAVSDDGCPVTNSQLMRRAMEYARGFGLLVISHCEALDLAVGGVMNEGPVATQMGLAGIPNAAEAIMVLRDIALCRLTGAPLHIAHVSCRESVAAIRAAKKENLPVTAETAPHYFSLTDEAVRAYNTNAKMNPPLRSEADRQAIREGLSDGTLDVIATDHAPHSSLEKMVEFDQAANGVIGLETSLPVSLGLVKEGILDMPGLIDKMSNQPSRILALPQGLTPGNPADITIIDIERLHTIEAEHFQSLSRNTPFDGWQMKGKAVLTMVAGQVVFDELTPHAAESSPRL